MKTVSRLIILLSIFAGSSLQAQSPKGFTDTILGTWTGQGTLFGQEAGFKMKWETELNGKFITLTFENSFEDGSGVKRVMNAHAYYHLEDKAGFWFDSRGMMLPLKLEVNENSMVVLWGDESSERGKTIYSMVEADGVNVQDFVLKGDAYIPFGEATYSRAKE